MRYALGSVEVLLAIAFIGSAIHYVVVHGVAVVPLATSLILGAAGLWLGKKAIGNFKPLKAPSSM